MIAEVLHIIRAGDDAESIAVCKGLAFKYREKSSTLSVWGPIAQESTETHPKELGANKVSIGVYYIAHGLGSYAGLLDPNKIVLRLVEILKEEGLKRLEKFVFVSCDSSPEASDLEPMKGAAATEPWDGNTNGSLIFNLLVLLDKRGSHPKVGAWDGYISALPRKEGDNTSIYPKPRPGTALTKEQLAPLAGKKIGHDTRFGLVSPAYRAAHKHTFQVVEGKVVVDNRSGWKHFT